MRPADIIIPQPFHGGSGMFHGLNMRCILRALCPIACRLIVATALCLGPAFCSAADYTWRGSNPGGGNYNGNWYVNPASPPTHWTPTTGNPMIAGDTATLINAGASYNVSLNADPSIASLETQSNSIIDLRGDSHALTLSGTLTNRGNFHFHGFYTNMILNANGGLLNHAGGKLTVGYSSILALGSSVFLNNGTIEQTTNTGMGWGKIRLDADVTFDGTGELLCGADIYSDTGKTLTNAAGHTIRHGAGIISVALTNHGTINGDRSGRALEFRTQPKTNSGLMKASNGGYLDIYTPVDQTGGGQLIADGSTVRLYTGAAIAGGTIGSAAGGEVQVVSGNTATFTNAVNEGYVHVLSGTAVLALAGHSLVNNGAIELTRNTGMGWGHLRLDDDVTLSGTGELLCKGDIYSEGGKILTQAAGHTIQSGGGNIHAALNNQGTVVSNSSTLAIGLRTNAKTNSGLMKASNGGYLDVYTPVDQTGGGQLIADGGTVRLYTGAAIAGGTISSASGSQVQVVSGNTATFTNAVNEGYVHVLSGTAVLALAGHSLVNNGAIELTRNTGMGWGHLRLDDNITLGGTGEILCNGNIYSDTGKKLTNLAGHALRRYGGTISVALDNRGIVEASGGGTLTLSGPVDQFSGSTLTGGTWIAKTNSTLNVSSASNVVTNQAAVILEGSNSQFARINTLADNQGAFSILGGRNFSTAGALLNSGTITVGAGSMLTVNGQYTQSATGKLQGGGTLKANLMENSGTVGPGESPGLLALQGDYRQTSDGRLAIEIGGYAPGNEFDVFSISGAAQLGGTLVATLTGNFQPRLGDEFLILSAAGGLNGSRFAAFDGPLYGGSPVFEVVYGTGSVALRALQSVPEPSTIGLLAVGLFGLLARSTVKKR